MAIDRNIIVWDQTDKAFKAKSYVEIFNMLLANKRAILGEELDLSVETALGEEMRMEAEWLYDFAKLAEAAYYTLDANNAQGAVLDLVVAFTSNLVRKQDIQSEATVSFNFEGSDISGSQSVYIQDADNVQWRIKTPGPFKSGQDYEVELISVSYGENYFVYPAVLLTVEGKFHSSKVEVTNPIYTVVGSVRETDEMLRQRKNNTLGHSSLTVTDSIRDYILKNIYSVKDVIVYNANGKKSAVTDLDSDRNLILPLQFENTVSEIKVLLHDAFVIVQPVLGLTRSSFIDGNSEPTTLSKAIVNSIRQKMTPGIATSFELLDSNEVIINDPNYISVELQELFGSAVYKERYSFYIANKYSPTITIKLSTRRNYDAEGSRNRIRDVIYDLSKTYTINRDIEIAEILSAVMSSNLDILNPSFAPVNIQVGSGSDEDIKVNNGFWLVDQQDEDWGIIIDDGYSTVRFETNGGDEVEHIVIKKGSTLVLPNVTKLGSTFSGWFTDEALTVAWNVSDVIINDMILYAKWE